VNVEQPIVIAAGDPGGVGPRVSVQAAYAARSRVPSAIFGDAAQLRAEARRLGCEPTLFVDVHESALGSLPTGSIGLVDTGRVADAVIARHAPSPASGAAQLHSLRVAANAVRAGHARALVTGPTSKAAISSAGQVFVGQTEFLAHLDGRADDDVTMLFLGPKLRVGLVTTHLSVADVSGAITMKRVTRSARHLAQALLRLFPQRPCSLVVAGLNPHAGEGGLFGREEIEVIEPALALLREETPFASGAVKLLGPSPAEAVFRAAQRGDVDGVLAMFHDQATIASKLLDWGAAVNTTWGMSFVRTSVDHGVAYDAAKAGVADSEGMSAALEMAVRLTAAPHG
jgi:4-hydroxythreonine-4-phosphate dehydrogenase